MRFILIWSTFSPQRRMISSMMKLSSCSEISMRLRLALKKLWRRRTSFTGFTMIEWIKSSIAALLMAQNSTLLSLKGRTTKMN
jgi:hypothetical protein